MKITQLAELIEARMVVQPQTATREITRACAGDRISDMLAHANADTLVITHVNGPGLARMLELLDVGALCLVGRPVPDPLLVAVAEEHGTPLLVAREELFEVCGRVYAAIKADADGAP